MAGGETGRYAAKVDDPGGRKAVGGQAQAVTKVSERQWQFK